MHSNTIRKQVLLDDVNIPYKFSLDRNNNKLFFCINADEFSDQSFLSAVLDLHTGFTAVVPSIRNGFASAVDNESGSAYLGGSDGIYKYNYSLNDIDKPALLTGIDVFDMQFKNNLYFIDTANLDLYLLKNDKRIFITTIEEYGIQHFTFDGDGDLVLSNPLGLYYMAKDNWDPVWFSNSVGNVRGLATDVNGVPHVIGQDGIYSVDRETRTVVKVLSLQDGYGLDFDKNNNMVYSDGRSVVRTLQ